MAFTASRRIGRVGVEPANEPRDGGRRSVHALEYRRFTCRVGAGPGYSHRQEPFLESDAPSDRGGRGFTDASVLITGESGTGKELVARLVHALDPDVEQPTFVVLDCTTIVPSCRAASSSATSAEHSLAPWPRATGAFALADGGTLFLDEVGELPAGLQPQLLRAIQEHTYKRVGGNSWQRTNFRLVCATNRDLVQAVARGAFRSDLYYRIASVTSKLPPLRERVEDILGWRGTSPGSRPRRAAARPRRRRLRYLLRRDYPGNVRDLKQVVFGMLARHVGTGPVTVGDVPEEERPTMETEPSGTRRR